MRIARLTTLYPEYLENFYSHNKTLESSPFKVQVAALDNDHFAWGDGYKVALGKKGIIFENFFLNAHDAQTAWARENLKDRNASLPSIAIHQIKEFKPDVLWFDNDDHALLHELKAEVPSIRLTMGYTGSAVSKKNVFGEMDLTISCAPEVVSSLNSQNIKSYQLHHAFNPDLLKRLNASSGTDQPHEIIFIGQLILNKDFHLYRQRILELLIKDFHVTIFTPNSNWTVRDLIKIFHHKIQEFPRAGIHSLKNIVPEYRDYLRLKKCCKPAVFGLESYRVMQQSKITFNIHADSSPRFASNARIFEIAGIGSCLLTDWKENMDDLFIDGKECVTYKSIEELKEKLQWLIQNPATLKTIASAGQKKILASHTFDHRTDDLLKIINANIK